MYVYICLPTCTPAIASFLTNFANQSTWCRGGTTVEAYTPWSVSLVALIFRLGFCFPPLTPSMGFNKSVRRCHSHFDFIESKALPGSPHSVPSNCLGSAFGLRPFFLGAHLVPALPTNTWATFIQARLHCSHNLLKGCPRPRARCAPDWSLCQIPL